jgi:hypothetical protein
LLILGEPEICHPENCAGRIGEAGVAWAPSPAKAVARNTMSTEKTLKTFMRGAGDNPVLLDYKRDRKVSLKCGCGGLRPAIQELTAKLAEKSLEM